MGGPFPLSHYEICRCIYLITAIATTDVNLCQFDSTMIRKLATFQLSLHNMQESLIGQVMFLSLQFRV